MWDLAEIPGVIVLVFITLTVSGGIVGLRQYRRYAEMRRTGHDPNDVLQSFGWVNYFKNNATWLLRELKLTSSSLDSSSRDLELGSCSPVDREASLNHRNESRLQRLMEVLGPDADEDVFTVRVSSEFGYSAVPDTESKEFSSLIASEGSADEDQLSIQSIANQDWNEALARFQDSNSPEPINQATAHSRVESWIEAVSEASADTESMVDSFEDSMIGHFEMPLLVQAFGRNCFDHLTDFLTDEAQEEISSHAGGQEPGEALKFEGNGTVKAPATSPETAERNPLCSPAQSPLSEAHIREGRIAQNQEDQRSDSPHASEPQFDAFRDRVSSSLSGQKSLRSPGRSQSPRNTESSDEDPFAYETINRGCQK